MLADRHDADPNRNSRRPVGKQGAPSERSDCLAWWTPFSSWSVTPYSQANFKHLPGARCFAAGLMWNSGGNLADYIQTDIFTRGAEADPVARKLSLRRPLPPNARRDAGYQLIGCRPVRSPATGSR